MKKNRVPRKNCANEGCRRAAQTGDRYCETCAIERSLYRRHDREIELAAPAPAAR